MDLEKYDAGIRLHGKGAFKILPNTAKMLSVKTLTFPL
jgi:hypothetical protein